MSKSGCGSGELLKQSKISFTDSDMSLCIKFIKRSVILSQFDGEFIIKQLDCSAYVRGYSNQVFRLQQELNEYENGSCELGDFFPDLNACVRDYNEVLSTYQALKNLHDAFGFVLEICRWLNETQHFSPEQFKLAGWDVTVFS